MAPEERRDLELDENTSRLDLSDHEMSKLWMREIEEAEVEVLVAQDGPLKKPGAGQASKGGDREVARKLGVSRQDIQRTRKHVETADEHPVFKGNDWSRGDAVDETPGELIYFDPRPAPGFFSCADCTPKASVREDLFLRQNAAKWFRVQREPH